MAARTRSKSDTVILIRLSALGDVAMTVPAVYDLCRAYPHKTFVLVTRSWMKALMAEKPHNLVVEGFEPKNYKNLAGLHRFFQELKKKYNPEAFIDLHDVLRTKVLRSLMRVSGVKTSVINKGRRSKKKLVKLGAQKYCRTFGTTLPTTIDRYRDAIRRAGYDAPERFESLFAGSTPTPTGVFRVGIAPFAAHTGKVYPLSLMEQVVDALTQRPDVEIYLFGAGASETATLDAWVKGRKKVINMAAAKAGLGAELKLMSQLDVMVAMDSGNMHMAGLAGTPHIVSVWGATHPSAGFSPWKPEKTECIGVEMDCRPCSVYGNKPCRFGDYRCLASIQPDRIIESVLKHLKNNG